MIKQKGKFFLEKDGWKMGDKVKCLEANRGPFVVGEVYKLIENPFGGTNLLPENLKNDFNGYSDVFEKVEPVQQDYELNRYYPNITGECPVHPDTTIDIIQQAGQRKTSQKAGSYNWSLTKFKYAGIVAFCVTKKVEEPKDPMDNSNEGWEDQPNSVNSDGGPTSYYDFQPSWKTWNDLADYKASKQWLEYSFHLGNVGKAIYRWGDKNGTSKKYDAKKIVYSGLRVLKMMVGIEGVRTYLEELLEDPQFKQ